MRLLVCCLWLLAGCDVVFLDEREPSEACHAAFVDGYYVQSIAQPWTDAEQGCESLQVAGSSRYAHLAVITDVAEHARLSELSAAPLWIGVSDRRSEGRFIAVTNEMGLLPFRADQPNGDDEQNCVLALPDGLQDKDCSELNVAVCECDGFPVDPERF